MVASNKIPPAPVAYGFCSLSLSLLPPHYKLLLQDSRVLRSAASRTLSQFDFFKTQQPLPFLERKMNKNYNFEDAMLVPTSLMAEMFSISPRWFRQLAVSAGCQPSCRNAWPLGPTLRAILAYQQTNRELAAEPSETDKVTHARTRQIETNIARIEASHISARESAEVFDFAAGHFLAELDSLPQRVATGTQECSRIQEIVLPRRNKLASKFSEIREATYGSRLPTTKVTPQAQQSKPKGSKNA